MELLSGFEPETSSLPTLNFNFFNLFLLFTGIFALGKLLSNTFKTQNFRPFRPCLWLFVWSVSYKTVLRYFDQSDFNTLLTKIETKAMWTQQPAGYRHRLSEIRSAIAPPNFISHRRKSSKKSGSEFLKAASKSYLANRIIMPPALRADRSGSCHKRQSHLPDRHFLCPQPLCAQRLVPA